MIRTYTATSLTGGGQGALDNIDASDTKGNGTNVALADGDTAVVIVPGDRVYFYQLDADSATAESSPTVISPDDNAGDKRWVLVDTYERGVVPVSKYASLTAAVTAIGATECTLKVNADTTITANTTIPSTLALEVRPGATITLGNYDLAINGGFTGADGCFAITGTGRVSGLKEYYPDWFTENATPGTTDMVNAINYAFDGADTNSATFKPTVYFKECAGYAVSAALVVGPNVNIDQRAPIKYTGSSDITVLTIGNSSGNSENTKYRLDVVRNSQGNWTSDDNVGIKLINLSRCSQVYVERAQGFTRGLVCQGEGYGFANNNVTLGNLRNNKYGLDLMAETGGWVNENTFVKGSFNCTTGVNGTLDRYGVRITSQSDAFGGGYYYSNNNYFLKPSFETGASMTTGTAYGILIEYGNYNKFEAARNEDNDYIAVFSNSSYENIVNVAYGFTTNSDTSTYKDNFVKSQLYLARDPDLGSKIFDSGPIHKRACWADGATSVNVPGVNLASSSNGTVYSYLSSITMGSDYLQLANTRGLGIFVKTSEKKRFVYRPDNVTSYGGRLLVQAFDSSGTILTSAGAGHPYVSGQNIATLTYDSSFGGVYRSGTDSTSDIFFTVTSDVDYIKVCQNGGTAVLRTRGFALYSVDGGNPSTWTGYSEIAPGVNIGTTTPTKGINSTLSAWSVGRMIYDATPASSAPMGWICVRSETSTANGGEPAAETQWAVADDQNAADGDIIGVTLDDGTVHWTAVSGAPAGNVITVASGVPAGRTIENGAVVVWFDFLPLANLP